MSKQLEIVKFDWCELPDTDKYRQAIENWIEFMVGSYMILESIIDLSDEKSDNERPIRRAICQTIHGATRRIHAELQNLGLPNNWKPADEFRIKDFKLPVEK